MYRTLALCVLLLFACGSDEEPVFRPTVPAPAATPDNEIAAFSLLTFRDVETGSTWNLRGEAIAGELAGETLNQIPGYSAYWFAWASFWPRTAVWGQGQNGTLADDTFIELPASEYVPDVPKDGIPPLDEPTGRHGQVRFDFDTGFLLDDDIIVGVAINGEARAYPVKILNWHEIVNHSLGGKKISLTYCPLTASGINFDGRDIDFGNTGGLHNNNMVMYDRTSESFWSQMKTSAILGERAGERLILLPVFQGTWQAWRTLYPETEVLTTDTGYSRGYDSDIYITSGYTQSTEVWFPQTPGIDDRYHPKDMVLGLLGEDTAKAYAFSRLEARGQRAVVNDDFEKRDIVVVFQQDARTALAFDRQVGDRTLSFELVE